MTRAARNARPSSDRDSLRNMEMLRWPLWRAGSCRRPEGRRLAGLSPIEPQGAAHDKGAVIAVARVFPVRRAGGRGDPGKAEGWPRLFLLFSSAGVDIPSGRRGRGDISRCEEPEIQRTMSTTGTNHRRAAWIAPDYPCFCSCRRWRGRMRSLTGAATRSCRATWTPRRPPPAARFAPTAFGCSTSRRAF